MDREDLLTHLVKMRELQLKKEAAELKSRAGALEKVERIHEQARSAASASIECGNDLRDLGVIGEMRLGCTKLAAKIEDQVRILSRKLGHARKLAESAREARAELKRTKSAARERSLENDAEHFRGWRKELKSGR